MEYNLELDRVISTIKKQKCKKVCIQLPDGLKPEAKNITDEITKSTNVEVIIWAGSCFGACDIPRNVKDLGVDLLVHFGHSEWK